MSDDVASRELVVQLIRRVATEKEALAEELGVSYASLYAWSTGRRRPGGRILERMAELAQRRAEELSGLAQGLGEAALEQRGDQPEHGPGGSGRRSFDGVGGRR